jgi:hypothetical protein
MRMWIILTGERMKRNEWLEYSQGDEIEEKRKI